MATLGELVGSKPKAMPPAPAVQPTVRMPDESDPAVIEARKKKRNEATGRGRESTVLEDTSSGASPSYTNDVLGK